MRKRRILIVDNNVELRVNLETVLRRLGHDVTLTDDRSEALARGDLQRFDVIISDLTETPETREDSATESEHTPLEGFASDDEPNIIKAFKLSAANFLRLPYAQGALCDIIEETLAHRLRYIDDPSLIPHLHEKIEFELPSDLALMNSVLQYLLDRVEKIGVIEAERSNLIVALDEAFVNAVKHGNNSDPHKLIRITAELSAKEASFTVEDEGQGFNVQSIPDPCDPCNLFKSSGRGVLLICNIMDEVEYNARGNRVKMVKRSAITTNSGATQLVEPDISEEKHASDG